MKDQLISLSEMCLQDNDSDFLEIDGCHALANCRNNAVRQVTSGGVCLLFHMSYHIKRFDLQICIPKTETLWVDVRQTVPSSSANIVIDAIHTSPDSLHLDLFHALGEILCTFSNERKNL